jgi:hypothetical protein
LEDLLTDEFRNAYLKGDVFKVQEVGGEVSTVSQRGLQDAFVKYL